MRILHVTPTYLPATRYGGPIQSVHGLCRALAARGHEVNVFTTNVDGAGNSDVPLGQPTNLDGVTVWYFPSALLRRLYWSPSMGQALRSQIKQFDIVHIHALYLWPTWAAARAARKNGVPYVLAPRGMLIRHLIRRKNRWIKETWIRLIDAKNIRCAAALQMTSELEAKEASAFNIRLPRLVVVPNGIDIRPDAATEISTERTDEPPFLLFLGRVNWEKGLDRLIPAMREVPDAKLIVAGNDEEGYTSELVRLAERAGVRERIDFVGRVEGQRKLSLLRHARMLILPSYSENFGIVLIEAMAEGCPVVVTPEVGLAEEVQAAGAGVISAGDPTELGRTIGRLLANPAQLAAMGKRGINAVRTRYSWSVIAADMESIYRQIVAQKA